eukprot:CAMPEP_0201281518 /NCGR_PEP_ID=MMETSP1317-20130820/3062_1 /ASSEMBLY_ACC=CAM_ASM_000770 /TAXON_ID=187299 /ORGANISM="Undescribed Undescribed, Strain Undescribed" /LENGTH=61 /DNA_ID=CAMNT_0047591507 /DNA_START=413 /DNA_END=598 /DNA_ORIENTATION=-
MDRTVSKEEGEALANQMGLKFVETSAKENKHVEDAFYELAKEVKSRIAMAGVKAQQTAGKG